MNIIKKSLAVVVLLSAIGNSGMHGMDIDQPVQEKLLAACKKQNVAKNELEQLYQQGANLEFKYKANSSATPLLIAAVNLNETAVKFLLDKKVDVNATDFDDNTPLLLAIRTVPSVAGLDSMTKEAFAAQKRKVVQILLDAGADSKIANFTGNTPLKALELSNDKDLINMIKYSSMGSASGLQEKLLAACKNLNVMWYELEDLYSAGAKLQDPYITHQPLMVAVDNVNDLAVAFILSKKVVDVNYRYFDSNTALILAIKARKPQGMDTDVFKQKRRKIVKMLLDAGADSQKMGESSNPLDEALKINDQQLVNMILNAVGMR